MGEILIPLILAALALTALWRQENAYDRLLEGAADGLRLMVRIAPTLVVLLSSVGMLRSSGAMDWAAEKLAPALGFLGIPPETMLLILVRPISGSAALAIGSEIMTRCGVDSLAGRTAAVMLGSTETTFYTISVYFGACGIQKTKYAVPAALIADAVGFWAASMTVRWFF